MMSNSRFIGNTDLTNVPGFDRVNDPNAPNFRPDPAAQEQIDAMDTNEDSENDEGGESEATSEAAAEGDALSQVYFDTGVTNNAILSGPQADIRDKALLQLRLTMTTEQIVDAVEAKQGKGAIKKEPLQRRYGKAFERVAEEAGIAIDELKAAFNKVTKVSRTRKTGWKRPDATKAEPKKKDSDDEDSDGAPPKRGQGGKSAGSKGKGKAKVSTKGEGSRSSKGRGKAKASGEKVKATPLSFSKDRRLTISQTYH